jgi:hypothetical protein
LALDGTMAAARCVVLAGNFNQKLNRGTTETKPGSPCLTIETCADSLNLKL